MTPALARSLRSGVLHDFEAAAAGALEGRTIAHQVMALVLQGRTTITEAIKVISWSDV
jgi:hypothetical protein